MNNYTKILIAVIVVMLMALGIYAFCNLNEKSNEDLPASGIVDIPNSENKNEEKEEKEPQISKYVQMYMDLLDDLMEQDKGLNADSEFIAIDFETFDKEYMDTENKGTTRVFDISKNDELLLIDYMKKYHEDIRNSNFDELKTTGDFDEENLYSKGLIIQVSNIEIIAEDHFKISMLKYRGGLAAVFPVYEVEFIDNEWKIDVVSMAIS